MRDLQIRAASAAAASSSGFPRGPSEIKISPLLDPDITGRAATARRLSASLFPQELSIRNLLNRYTAKHGIILEVLLDKTVIAGPTHLGRFRRNPPVIQIR